MANKLGEKIIKLRTKTYKIIVSYFPEYKKNCWEAYELDKYNPYMWHKMSLMTRAEENSFPKTLGFKAQEFLHQF